MERNVLLIDSASQQFQVDTFAVDALEKDSREKYLVLSGESLCQYLLRRDPETLVIARGPTPFLTGHKVTVGYISPLTGLPHYSYVGGRAAAQLFNLGLDAIAFKSKLTSTINPYIVVSGRSPSLTVEFKKREELPASQRSAFYWLVESELNGNAESGSVLTLGDGAFLGYLAANLAAEGIYHAGRGGVGAVFAQFASALVLNGEPISPFDFFDESEKGFSRNPNRDITPFIDQYCHRLSSRTGGTIVKLYKTGGKPEGENTLPAWNAKSLGYAMADAGDERILAATREGQTGCHWCQVHCRHYHSVPVDYSPTGYDLYLDDFEPAYAVHAMLGLTPAEDTFDSRLELIAEVDERLMQPIEQLGLDVIDIGLALSALFEGVNSAIIPESDVPDFVVEAKGLGNLEAAERALSLLGTQKAAEYPALRAVGDGPQSLSKQYPDMQDVLFTCGEGTLGNPGHCNALWTFLMPFSRFFSHYSGQIYKISGELPLLETDEDTIKQFSRQIVEQMLQREYFWLLCNAFSLCAFTFVIFSKNGKGNVLRDDDLFTNLLKRYDIHLTNEDLNEFSQSFWAQSIDLKCQYGWRPQSAKEFPRRVYEALSASLDRSPEELETWMGHLVEEWKRQAGEVLIHYGYEPVW